MEFFARTGVATAPTGSFVPFTIVAGCSTDKAIKENLAQALEGELVEVSEIRFDWPQFLPAERATQSVKLAGNIPILRLFIRFDDILGLCLSHLKLPFRNTAFAP